MSQNFFVALVIVLNATFAAAILYLILLTQVPEPKTLITCWFGFTTVELVAMAGIKITKTKNPPPEKIRRDM